MNKRTARPAGTENKGLVEMNLCEFPIGTLTDSHKINKEPLVFKDIHKDKKTNQDIEKFWIISGCSTTYGTPIATDNDILMGLKKLTKEHGYLEQDKPTIRIGKYELLKAINWPIGSTQYRQLFEALFRLGCCKITTNAFWLKEKSELISITFSLADSFSVYGKKTGNDEIDAHIWDFDFIEWTWGSVVWNSMKVGYLKSIDMSFYNSLKRPLTKRLYNYIDKIFNNPNKRDKRLKKPIKILCYDRLGVRRIYNLGHLKRELKKATDELVKKGYILPPVYVNTHKFLNNNYYYLEPNYDAKRDKDLKDFIILEPAPKSLPVVRASGQCLPVVLPLPVGQEKTLDACGLVTHFLAKMMHKRAPMSKEILQAQELISKYGGVRARQIIDYAISKVMTTFSEPTEYFGGLLIYEARALDYTERVEQNNKAKQEKIQKETAEYEANLAEKSERLKLKAIIELLGAPERAELEAEARQNLLKKGTPENFITPSLIEPEAREIIRKRLQKKES